MELPCNWDEPDSELLDNLTHQATFAADIVAIGFIGTGADRTSAVIRAALRALLANGLITAVPPQEWPEYIMLDAPR